MTKLVDILNGEEIKELDGIEFKIKHENEFCRHLHIIVDKDEREIRCEECNSVLDPFDYLLECAIRERRLFWSKQEYERLINILKKEHEELDRTVKNLKAQKNRLLKGAKQPA